MKKYVYLLGYFTFLDIINQTQSRTRASSFVAHLFLAWLLYPLSVSANIHREPEVSVRVTQLSDQRKHHTGVRRNGKEKGGDSVQPGNLGKVFALFLLSPVDVSIC